MDEAGEAKVNELIKKYPLFEEFLINMGVFIDKTDNTVEKYVELIDDFTLEEAGLSRRELEIAIESYLRHLQVISGKMAEIHSLTVLGGISKYGEPEEIKLQVKAGEVVCVVGPTGSGKSRLLEDIECLAQGDTPTGRKIMINNQDLDKEVEVYGSQKTVAQLSQNMNFIMDTTVEDFIKIHAESRMIGYSAELAEQVLEQTNSLSGEKVNQKMPLASLSGGQSRALMIADIACLCSSPVVLIDEIENAGINREKAMELLVKKEKIIFIATHDPLLSLLGNKRLVMKGGGMARIIERTKQEQLLLQKLQTVDHKINKIREIIRGGQTIDEAARISPKFFL